MNTPSITPKRNKKFGGILFGSFEITYEGRKKSWQIWHPEYGFMAAYREKDKAIEYCKMLIQ